MEIKFLQTYRPKSVQWPLLNVKINWHKEQTWFVNLIWILKSWTFISLKNRNKSSCLFCWQAWTKFYQILIIIGFLFTELDSVCLQWKANKNTLESWLHSREDESLRVSLARFVYKKSPLIRESELSWWSRVVTKGVVRSEITAQCGCNLARKRWRENLQLYEAELWLSTLRVMCISRDTNDRRSWEPLLWTSVQRFLLIILKSYFMYLVNASIQKLFCFT